MAREAGVCYSCYKKCLLLHRGKHDQSQKAATFFKVMFGKRFDELLFVPPKHSGMLTSLVGKTSYLEDSAGREWEVVLSYEEGCLAFKKGWPVFSRDHSIEQGDFLVFHFNNASHFMVTIYGRSGWEKTFSCEQSNQNKRIKTTKNFTTKKFPSNSLPKGLGLQQEYNELDAYVPRSDINSIFSHEVVKNVDKSLVVARNAPKRELIVEPFFLTEKETTDDRERLLDLDLSAFELPDLKTSFDMEVDNFYLFDHPNFMMNENTTDTREDHTENLPSVEFPNMNSSFAKEEDVKFQCDLSTSKKIDNMEDANQIGEPQGNECSKEPGLHGVLTGDASTDTNESQPGQGNTAQSSKEHEAIISTPECSPIRSVSQALDMAIDSPVPLKTIKKFDNFEPSAAESGYVHPPVFNFDQLKCSQVPDSLHTFQVDNASLGQGNAVLPTKNEAILSTSECCPTASVSPALDMALDPMPLKAIKKFENFEPSAAESGYDHPPVPGSLLTFQAGDDASLGQENAVLPTKESKAILSTSECCPTASVSPALDMPPDSPTPLKTIKKFDNFELSAAQSGYIHLRPPGLSFTKTVLYKSKTSMQGLNDYLGGTLRIIKQEPQEPREFGQDLFSNLDKKPEINHGGLGLNFKSMESKKPEINKRGLGVNLKTTENDLCNREDIGVNIEPMEDDVCNHNKFDANLQTMGDDICNRRDLGANLDPMEEDVCNCEELGVNLKPVEDEVSKEDVFNREDLGSNLKPMEDEVSKVDVCNREDLGANLKPMEDEVSNHEDLGANLKSMENDVLVIKIVKSEPDDFGEPESELASAGRITCSIPPGSEHYLDLPEPLPMKQRQKRLKQKLILLRDPDGDDWPVIYHDRNSIKVLASGWNAFRKANKVSPGDECAFVGDESDRGIFHVHILKS